MPDRLSSQDVSFLYLENPETAMHVGSVMIFQPDAAKRRGAKAAAKRGGTKASADAAGPDVANANVARLATAGSDAAGPDTAGGAADAATAAHPGFDIERLTRHVGARIAFVPRYRQRIRAVPGRIANPVWVDDESFDLTYHVRRSALPTPGSDEQLAELVARLQSRPLDRRRPLWELVVVEGLSGGRFAVVTKVHQALVDGVRTVDLGQVILDDSPRGIEPPSDTWRPPPEPGALELLAGAVTDSVRRPQQAVDVIRSGLADVRDTSARAARSLGGLARIARNAAGAPATSPFNQKAGEHRRFSMVATDLGDYRKVRTRLHRDDKALTITVNDVVLATLAGALRSWLMQRGDPVPPGSIIRTLVPVSVRLPDPAAGGALGSRVSSLLVDLPTGEASPVVRVHQVAYQTKAHRDAGQAVDAPALMAMTGFAPPTLHSLGARVASGLSRRMFHLIVTNVPGPQHPLYLAGARMTSSYPVVPLTRGQVLSVGLTSYDGGVYYGLNADRDAMTDLDVVAQCIHDALAELVEAVR
jgi:WS/DGAT/MGAT family acyltransferase